MIQPAILTETRGRAATRSIIRTGLLVLGAFALTACSTLSRLNPFAAPSTAAPTELSEIRPTMTVRTLWSASVGTGGNYFFSPAIADGNVYAAAADGTVAKVALQNGATVWRVKVADALSAGVGSDGRTTVVAASNGDVIALNVDGTQRWKIATTSEILSAPAVGGGMVVVRTSDHRVLGLDAESGERRWLHRRASPALVLRGAPGLTIANNMVYAGFPGGRLAALMLANGNVRWDVSVAVPRGATELERVADVVGRPVLSGGEVCVATFQGRAGCFDAATGNPAWTRDVSTGTGIDVDTRFAFVTDDQSVVQGFARSGGASVWRNDRLRNRKVSAPASVGRAAVVADYRGIVHWLSREDGGFMARAGSDGSAVVTQPLAFSIGASSAVLLQTQAGALYAFGSD